MSWYDEEGQERSGRVRLVDFDDPAANRYLAVNQLTIIIGKKNRRPDVLLFVNGLPLGQVELKNPAAETATATAARQPGRATTPRRSRSSTATSRSSASPTCFTARVGHDHDAGRALRRVEDDGPDGEAATAARGHDPRRLRARAAAGPGPQLRRSSRPTARERRKVMAKYHQVDAVNRAVEATAAAMQGDGRAGVVWHTQGSGKSYTMVFYVDASCAATRASRTRRSSA